MLNGQITPDSKILQEDIWSSLAAFDSVVVDQTDSVGPYRAYWSQYIQLRGNIIDTSAVYGDSLAGPAFYHSSQTAGNTTFTYTIEQTNFGLDTTGLAAYFQDAAGRDTLIEFYSIDLSGTTKEMAFAPSYNSRGQISSMDFFGDDGSGSLVKQAELTYFNGTNRIDSVHVELIIQGFPFPLLFQKVINVYTGNKLLNQDIHIVDDPFAGTFDLLLKVEFKHNVSNEITEATTFLYDSTGSRSFLERKKYVQATNNIGLAGLKASAGLEIYPNPARSQLQVKINEPFHYQICDLSGKVLMQAKCYQQQIDVSALKPGKYLLKVDGKSSTSFLKI